MKALSLLICFVFFGLLLAACQPSSPLNNQQEYILHFGEQGVQDFVKYSRTAVDHQPAGASFRDLDFAPPNLGKVKIENGVNSLGIDYVFSVLGSQMHKNEGIQILDIDLMQA